MWPQNLIRCSRIYWEVLEKMAQIDLRDISRGTVLNNIFLDSGNQKIVLSFSASIELYPSDGILYGSDDALRSVIP